MQVSDAADHPGGRDEATGDGAATGVEAATGDGAVTRADAPTGEADPAFVEVAVEVFAMLADPTRVRIVLALREGEQSVGALAEAVGKSPTAVSQHLAKLRLARMVAPRHEGTRVFYRLVNAHAARLVTEALQQAEHAVDGVVHHREPAERG